MTRRYSFLLRALSIALLLSLGANLVLLRLSIRNRRQIALLLLDPLGLRASAASATSPSGTDRHAGQRRLVMLGDSRAEAWPAPAGLPGLQVINRGIGGQTSAQVADRYFVQVQPLQPQIIVLQVGVNDLWMLGFLGQQVVDSCKANITQIVNAATRDGAVVVLTTIFPTANSTLERQFYDVDDLDSRIAEVNRYIHTLQSAQVIVFDAAAVLQDEQGLVRPEFASDLLHINTRGYAALNAALLPILAQLTDTTSPQP